MNFKNVKEDSGAVLNETLKRILTAIVILPIAISCLFLPYYHNLAFFIVILIASIFMSLELISITQTKDIPTYTMITITTVICIIFIEYISVFSSNFPNYQIITLIMLLSLFFIFSIETFKYNFQKSLETVSTHLLIIIYCALSIIFIFKLIRIDPFYFLYIWLITWITDSAAYFSGKYFGKHKLNLKVSPNKTLEGFIGGIVFAIIIGILFKYLYESYHPQKTFLFSYPIYLFLTFFFAVVTIFGDLAESVMKRSSGVKDSKTYIPGHGGMLDVMDSLVFTTPLFYFIIYFTYRSIL